MLPWLDYFSKGGFLMWPILACSLLGLAVTLERLVALRRSRIFPRGFLDDIRELARRGKILRALERCQGTWQAGARLVETALARHQLPREQIKEALEQVGRREAAKLEGPLSLLATVANVSPLLGLLGTVVGMIRVFNQISTSVNVNPASLAGGIYMALITTAAGLVVAIPALLMHHYLLRRVQALAGEMEEVAGEVLELLTVDYVEPEGDSLLGRLEREA